MPPIPHSPIFGQLQIYSCGFEGKDLLIKKDPSSCGHFDFLVMAIGKSMPFAEEVESSFTEESMVRK